MTVTLLVRYGELALKSPPVRREFERALQRNILEQFRSSGRSCRLRADHGHVYVLAEDGSDPARLVRRVFGVTSTSEVVEVSSEPGAIRAALLDLAEPLLRPSTRFAIRARRTGQHAFTSQELARTLGAAVLERWPDRSLRVDLDHPEVELHVEVRGPRTYLYRERTAGPGGLPLGVAGRVVALVDGTRGALGAYLMMKRGCRCAIVATPPGTALVREVLARFDPGLAVEEAADAPLDRLAALAERTRADAVVLPLSVEQYGPARTHWGDRVVFSPTVGFATEEVEERWRAIASLAA